MPEWGVITGYKDDGKVFLCQTYFNKSDDYEPAQKWPWVIIVINGKKDAPNRREIVLKSLDLAVELANTEKYEVYASGFAAYEKWIGLLQNEKRFKSLTEDQLPSQTLTNAVCYYRLVDARSSAARYLESVRSHFNPKASAHVTKAANLYCKVAEKLANGMKFAPFPGQSEGGKLWNKDMRQAEIEILNDVILLEKNAINELSDVVKIERAELEVKGR
jgi:Fe-S cluster biosynthesis and repair protein YggX